jgi:hypothetical protein
MLGRADTQPKIITSVAGPAKKYRGRRKSITTANWMNSIIYSLNFFSIAAFAQ